MTRPGPAMSRSTASLKSSTRRRSVKQDEDFIYDCKAAYHVVFDDVSDDIENKDQLTEVLQQSGRNPSRKNIYKYWKGKSISFEEFCDICAEIPKTSTDDLLKAFKRVDANGDGYISNRELRRMLTSKGEKMTEEEVAAIIEEVDENGDGKLDYKEFCNLLLSTQDEVKKLGTEKMEKKKKGKYNDKSSTSSKHLSSSSRSRGSKDDSEGEDIAGAGSMDNTPTGSQSSLRDQSSRHSFSRSRKGSDGDSVAEKPPLSPKPKLRQSPRGETKKHTVTKTPEPAKAEKRKETKLASESDSDDSDDSDMIVIPHGLNRSALLKTAPASLSASAAGKPPVPLPRRNNRPGDYEDEPSSRDSRDRGNVKPALSTRSLRLTKPSRLKDWQTQSIKGCFLFEEDNTIISHHYKLKLTEDSSVWITIEPKKADKGSSGSRHREAPVDTLLFLLREDNSIITFTEQRDEQGKYGLRCDLDAGTYKVIPFTTGCRLKRRRDDPEDEVKLVKTKDGEVVLTKQFRDVLTEIFHMADLDTDGLLSREEFSLYNVRVSGEEVSDEEWEVVEENVELEDGKLTLEGFLKLNQMEAEDTDGDPEELWVTLSSWGFNKALKLDEACPYVIEAFVEECNFDLAVTGLKPGGRTLESAIIEATKGKGESRKIKGMRDLFLHTYTTDYRACYVVENKSQSKVAVQLDYSRSRNSCSSRKGKTYTVDVPRKSVVVALHLMPQKETEDWTLTMQESVA